MQRIKQKQYFVTELQNDTQHSLQTISARSRMKQVWSYYLPPKFYLIKIILYLMKTKGFKEIKWE